MNENPEVLHETVLVKKDDELKLWQIINSSKFFKYTHSPFAWHKITLIGGGPFPKEDLLDLLISRVAPSFFLPVKYQTDGKNSFFYVQNCPAALKVLANNMLVFFYPKAGVTINMTLELNTPVNKDRMPAVHKVIKDVFKKRCSYKAVDESNTLVKIINLSNFSNNKKLADIYCPLHLPKIFQFVANYAKAMKQNMKEIIVLANNKLSSLEHFSNHFTDVLGLDIRNNLFDWEGIGKLGIYTPIHLWVEGNPFCLQESSPLSYITKIKSLHPNLLSLDGVEIPQNDFLLVRNFLLKRSCTRNLVDKFLAHYFGLFSNLSQRHLLINMYHRKAQLSFSTCFLPNQIPSSNNTRLASYSQYNRELFRMSNYNNCYVQLKIGPEEIISHISKLPSVEFVPLTFTVDLPFLTEDKTSFLMNVNGLLKELGDYIYTFHMVFFVTQSKNNEWLITNQMITLSNATTQQVAKMPQNEDTVMSPMQAAIQRVKCDEEEEKKKLIKQVEELTTMNTRFSTRFLEDARWNLEEALQAFTDQYKAFQISIDAFAV